MDNYTQRAREALGFAQGEAQAMGNAYIGTEHLLLGLLLQREGVAAYVLGMFNLTAEQIREYMHYSVHPLMRSIRIDPQADTPRPILVSPQTEAALNGATTLARKHGSDRIGTEHLLRGLLGSGGLGSIRRGRRRTYRDAACSSSRS